VTVEVDFRIGILSNWHSYCCSASIDYSPQALLMTLGIDENTASECLKYSCKTIVEVY
jgi:hypothetical protein